jgi:hypothetical protein
MTFSPGSICQQQYTKMELLSFIHQAVWYQRCDFLKFLSYGYTSVPSAFCKKNYARLFEFARQSVCAGTNGNSENTFWFESCHPTGTRIDCWMKWLTSTTDYSKQTHIATSTLKLCRRVFQKQAGIDSNYKSCSIFHSTVHIYLLYSIWDPKLNNFWNYIEG